MTKRFIMWLVALLAAASSATFLFFWLQPPARDNGLSKQEIAARIRQLGGASEIPAAGPAVALDPKRPIRLAIGSLGQGDDSSLHFPAVFSGIILQS